MKTSNEPTIKDTITIETPEGRMRFETRGGDTWDAYVEFEHVLRPLGRIECPTPHTPPHLLQCLATKPAYRTWVHGAPDRARGIIVALPVDEPEGHRELQYIVADLLAHATNHEPHVLLVGNVTAAEVARVATFVDCAIQEAKAQ